MLHNIVSIIAIHVYVNMDKPWHYIIELEEKHLWLHLSKMLQYAEVCKDLCKLRRALFSLEGMKSIELEKGFWGKFS